MEKQESIDAWFALVPEQAKATARRLLLEVDNLRREEVIYPPQGDILNALAYVAPEDVRAVILGQDPYHGPGQARSFRRACAISIRKWHLTWGAAYL